MTIAPTGAVGIGTTNPDANRQLTLEGKSSAAMIARTTDGPHEVLIGAIDSGSIVTANTPGDDLLLAANGGDRVVWVKANGRVGVNNDSPGHDVSIKGTSKAELAVVAAQGTDRRILVGADSNGVYAGSDTNHDLRLITNNNEKVRVTADGKVGIGTNVPLNMLDVRGEIRLGSVGQFFAPGGAKNYAVIGGNLPLGTVFPASGPGWQAFAFGSGKNQVQFTPALAGAAFVTVTQIAGGPISIPVISGQDGAGFNLAMWNPSGLDAGFSFIALAER